MNRVYRKRIVLLWCGLVLSAFSQSYPLDEKSTLDGAKIRTLLKTAVQAGSDQVTIPPGTYRMGLEEGAGAHLLIHNAKNLEIIANGVLILCNRPQNAPLVQFLSCSNVTLRGLSVDCDPLAYAGHCSEGGYEGTLD